MGSLPLHPALVHFPVALAILLPLFAIGAALMAWRAPSSGRPWLVVPVLALLLVASGLAAMSAGQEDEEKVERVVPKAAIHEHEDWAETLIWTASGTLVLALLGLAKPPKLRKGAMAATIVASLAVAGLAVKTGEEGGRLVYVYDAPQAHGAKVHSTPAKNGIPPAANTRKDDDDE